MHQSMRKERSNGDRADGRPSRWGGRRRERKGPGARLSTQEQLSTKAHELGEDVSFQVREQLDQRSTQAGEQVQAMGHALQSGSSFAVKARTSLRKVMAQVAKRAEDAGAYLQSAQADRILIDLERFAQRRPWVTAGVGLFAGFVASRFVKASADRRYETRGAMAVAMSRRRGGASFRRCVDDECR